MDSLMMLMGKTTKKNKSETLSFEFIVKNNKLPDIKQKDQQVFNQLQAMQIDHQRPKQQSGNSSSAIHLTHYPIKKLIQFVSIFPENPNVVFFIFGNQSSNPKKFFSLYPSAGTDFQKFGITCIQTYINKEKTLMVGLDKSFINLSNQSDGQSLTQKHLIFLYLIKKSQSARFVLCFDKNSIKQSAFLTVKNTFNRLATTLDFQKRKNYGKSFMILISHFNEQDIEEIENICEGKFKQSIKEQTFFKENHNFVKQIINDIFKPSKRSEKRFVGFFAKFTQKQFDSRRESFQKVLSITIPTQGSQILDIKDKLYDIFTIKSQNWKPLDLVSQKLDRNADRTKNDKKKNHSTTLENFFQLWDHTFCELMKFISEKVTKGKGDFQNFTKSQGFLIDRISDKYHLNCEVVQQKHSFRNESKAYEVSYFLSRLMVFLNKNVLQNEKIKKLTDQNRNQYFRESLKEFFQVLYGCEILSNKNEKVIYDFFMVMNQLFGLLEFIVKPKDDKFINYFEFNQLMISSLANIGTVKKLFSNIVKALNFIFNIQFSRIEKGQHVQLESMETSIKTIKQIMDQQLKTADPYHLFQNKTLRKTIARYQKELLMRKINKLSSKPLTKICFALNYLRKQTDILQNLHLLDIFAKSCLHYIRQYKEDKNNSLDIKLKIIELLEFNINLNFNLICQIYQKEIDVIIQKVRINLRQFDENETKFILKYTDFVIKTGLLQKLRQKAYEISAFDKGLSKKMLCRALMRDCAKSHLEFIKSDTKLKKILVSAQEEQQKKIELGIAMEAIETLDKHFKKDKFSEEFRLRQEQKLLDI